MVDIKKPHGCQKKARKKKPGGVKWDEHNLEENERIKRELNPTKIDEPKTPYHRGVSDDEDDEDSLEMSPLSLSDEVKEKKSVKLSAFEKCLSKNDGVRVMIGDGHPSSSVAMEEDQDLDEASKEEKRKKFLEARKQHYKVGRVLLKPHHHPMDEDEDDGD